jgi:hypothetical protein
MSEEIWPVAMVTGHRRVVPADRPWVAEQLSEVATKLRTEHGTETAVSGMALEVDTTWAEIALEQGLKLVAAIPFPSQSCDPVAPANQQWTVEQQVVWASLVSQAIAVHMVSDRDPRDFKERVAMLHKRNDVMLRAAQVVVGVWDEGNLRSGTSSCLRKAYGAGLPIILLNLKHRGRPRRPSDQWWSQALQAPMRRSG